MEAMLNVPREEAGLAIFGEDVWKHCSVGMGMFSMERRIKLSSAGAAHSARVPVGRSWHSKGVGLAQPVLHAQLQDLWYSRLHPHLPPHKLLLYGGFSSIHEMADSSAVLQKTRFQI